MRRPTQQKPYRTSASSEGASGRRRWQASDRGSGCDARAQRLRSGDAPAQAPLQSNIVFLQPPEAHASTALVGTTSRGGARGRHARLVLRGLGSRGGGGKTDVDVSRPIFVAIFVVDAALAAGSSCRCSAALMTQRTVRGHKLPTTSPGPQQREQQGAAVSSLIRRRLSRNGQRQRRRGGR